MREDPVEERSVPVRTGSEEDLPGRGTVGQSAHLCPGRLPFSGSHYKLSRDLHSPPANRLEKLTGDRAGQYSIRINDRWRTCFEWRDGDAYNVEIVDYH